MLQVRNHQDQENLHFHFSLWDPSNIRLGLRRCWNTKYVWTRSAMSMIWVGCLNHNPQHDTRRNRPNHLLPPLCVWERAYAGVASIWPLATIGGAETLYICITKTWYEYEFSDMPQS
jgi:hypothetical protein